MIAECQEGILLLARGDGSRPDGSFFLHRMTGEHELPQAGSPLTDGRYSLEIKRRVALCGARESAAPAAGAKRKGHLRFPTLNFEAFSISAILRILKLINASKTHFSINNSKSYYKMRKTFFFWFVQFHIVLEVYEPQTLV